MKSKAKTEIAPAMKKRASDFSEREAGESFAVECFGVALKVRSNRRDLIEKIKEMLSEILPVKFRMIAPSKARHSLLAIFSDETVSLYDDEEPIFENSGDFELQEILTSRIRMTVAEFTKKYAFLHAGVIGWKDRAIVIPGQSFSGKSTLVKEFVERGALYFSDEYAVIDEKGFAHPFPKKLSIRGIINDIQQVDISCEELGGKTAREPLPVEFLVVSKFEKNRRQRVSRLTAGEGMMAMVENSLSVRRSPQHTLNIFKLVAANSVVLKVKRAEAPEFVDFFLQLVET